MIYAELLFTGDELVDGSVINGNAVYLSEELTSMGIKVARHMSVGDEVNELVAAMQEMAARKPGVMIISGGLGSTPDDLTVEALAKATKQELVFDAELFERIEASVGDVDQVTRDQYRKQAYLPAGAVSLEPVGTAPGISFKTANSHVFCLPGVPREMVTMFERDVRPALVGLGAEDPSPVARLKLVGKLESELASELADLNWDGPVRISTVATPSEVTIVLRSKKAGAGSDLELDKLRGIVEDRLGRYIYTDNENSMAEVVGSALKEAGRTLALAESCTGGLVTKELTDVPGSSAYLMGGAVVYSDESKTRLLGVPEELLLSDGAVSEKVALALAKNVRQRFGSDYGISVTGLAGPGSDDSNQPIGTVFIGLADGEGEKSAACSFSGNRDAIRQQAAMTALNMLRLELVGG